MGKNKKIYLLRIPELNVCKIGISNNPEKRIKELQTGCPYKLEIRKVFESKHASKLEKILHHRFSHLKADDEIHNLSGEYFNLTINDVINFEETCKKIEKCFDLMKESKNPFV